MPFDKRSKEADARLCALTRRLYYNSDYESFTNACFPADMYWVGGRSGLLGAARTRPWDEIKMSGGQACRV
jgi:hypothetical protein